MIFYSESRIKNQKSESMMELEFDWNQISNQENQKSESMRFFGSVLFIKIADVNIYRSLFFNLV